MTNEWLTARVAEFREHGFPITDAAETTVANITPVPLEDGGIQVELHSGGVDVEILVNAAGEVEDLYLHRVDGKLMKRMEAQGG